MSKPKSKPKYNETADALSVMTDAIEGPGLAYWAEAKNVRRNKNNDVTSFYVRANDNEETAPKLREWRKVDASKVIAAASAIRNGRIDISRDLAAQFIPPYEYDSDGTDSCIQVVVFGELVFG